MLDPRIYRTSLLAVALAVIVVAFSLRDQPGSLATPLAPDAFNGQNAFSLTRKLAARFPDRPPGSAADAALADTVAHTFKRYGFAVATSSFKARSAVGTRQLETVTGTRAGSGSGSILVVAHRDALRPPSTSDLSGTATLLELARVLAGETHRRTIVLASISGSAGAAGATQLARDVGTGADAVIALGDLGAPRLRAPVIVPWADGQGVAPPLLRNTAAAALRTQARVAPGTSSLALQLVHLAFPLTLGEQGPFGARGVPAVTISGSGERPADPLSAVSQPNMTTLGSSTLQTINALDTGPNLPAVKPYLVLQGKLLPAWAIRLLAFALLLPVLLLAVDGLARARRRGHAMTRWLLWTLVRALPFGLVYLAVLAARLSGLVGKAPAQLVGAGAVPLQAGGIALLAAVVCLLVLSFLLLRLLPSPLGNDREEGAKEASLNAAAVAILLVMSCASFLLAIANPFAALFVMPALHLWIWALDLRLGAPPALRIALLLAGLIPPALVAVLYALSFGFGPLDVAWNGVLLLAGGHLTPQAVILWSLLLGCAASAFTLGVRGMAHRRRDDAPVTIRGPIGYAGPGSLGGTESALRR
jgi:hypothetical protein